MAKTRGGHTVNTGRQSARTEKARQETVATKGPRTNRRSNRIADLGVSSRTMKRRGESSKGTSPEFVSIPASPLPVPNPHGTALTFRSPKFSKRFQNLMMNKSIVYGKFVDPVLFHQIGVYSLFEAIGLTDMLHPSPIAYPILIKQFFGNMSVKSDTIVTYVKNKSLSFGSELLGTILNIPCTGVCPFTLKGPFESENFSLLAQLNLVKNSSESAFVELPTVVETSPMNSVIHKLIRANLVPRTGGRSDMTFQDLILSALILSGTKFNFALFMIKNMESCLKNKTKCFPYGCFITKIFEYFNISLENDEAVNITDTIDEASLHKSLLKVNADGLLVWDLAHSSTIVISSTHPSSNSFPSSSAPPPDPNHSELLQFLHAMDHKLDSVLTSAHSLSTKIDSLEIKIQDIDKKLEEVLFATVTVEDN